MRIFSLRVWLPLYIFIISACSEKIGGERLYAPYLEGQEAQWVSRSDALKSAKFNGIVEVSKFVSEDQTVDQKKAADDLYQKTLETVQRRGWFDVEKAIDDGYRYEPQSDETHFPNYDFIFDSENLNPERPEQLLFYKLPQGRVLVGVMFLMNDRNRHGKQVGGQETTWHFHHYDEPRCVAANSPKLHKLSRQYERGNCEDGFVQIEKSPEMLHVWFVEHPEGRFATSMSIEENLVLSSPFAAYARKIAIKENPAGSTVDNGFHEKH